MVAVDADYKVAVVNRAYTDLTGYTSEEAVGRPPHFHISSPEGRDIHKRMWEGLKKDGIPFQGFIFFMIKIWLQ